MNTTSRIPPHTNSDSSQKPPLSSVRDTTIRLLPGSLGLACYIAWSFTFWNGSLLFGGNHVNAPIPNLFAIQGILTALSALAIAFSVRRIAPLYLRKILLGGFAVISSAAVFIAAWTGFQQAPAEWVFLGFAMSGIGSMLRLGWEEELSGRGVKTTAFCAATAYLIGFALFAIISVLPSEAALITTTLLPFGAWALLLRENKGKSSPLPKRGDTPTQSLPTLLLGMPWKLIVVIMIAFFGYGATRIGGIASGFATSASGSEVLAGVPALASFLAIAIAYFVYRKNARLALYIAFPLMALASLLPPSVDPFSGGTTFSTILIGAELVKYIIWFLAIELFMKDKTSMLLCLALMRCAQWTGSCLGQLASDVLPTHESVAIAILLSLVIALLALVGSPLMKGAKDPSTESDTLPLRVEKLSSQFGLSPREKEVLSVWVTGHSGAYLEKTLFISKNTVKTHLNHIYKKTDTANREELLELLESVK